MSKSKINLNIFRFRKSSVEYQCQRSKVHSSKRHHKIGNKLKDNTKTKVTMAWNPRTLLQNRSGIRLISSVRYKEEFVLNSLSRKFQIIINANRQVCWSFEELLTSFGFLCRIIARILSSQNNLF